MIWRNIKKSVCYKIRKKIPISVERKYHKVVEENNSLIKPIHSVPLYKHTLGVNRMNHEINESYNRAERNDFLYVLFQNTDF